MRSPDVPAAEPNISARSANSPRRGLSLRWWLALLVIADVIPLLVFILGYQYLEYRRDVAATGLRALALARGTAMLVDSELQARIAALQSLAVSRSLADGDLETFRKKAALIAGQQFPAANILLLRQDGQPLFNTLGPAGIPPDIESTRTVFMTGRPSVSNVHDGAAGRPVVAIDVPVQAPDGTTAYVLSMNPRLEDFADVIRRQLLPPTWWTAVLDRRGVAVARLPNGAEPVGNEFAHPLTGQEGVIETTSREGVPVLAVFSHADRFGWAVVIGVPQTELTGPAFSAATRTLAVGALLLVVGLVLALYAARAIAGPIGKLRRLAAATDLDTPPDLAPTGLRDLDDVANALTAAAEDRRRSRQAEAVLRDGIESISEGFVIYDDEDRLVMCNSSYRQLLGAAADTVVPGARFADIRRAALARGTYPASAESDEGWAADSARKLRNFDDGVEQELKGGRWVLVRKSPLSNGWVAGLRIDITARKRIEQALAKSEERFRRVVEAVPNAIVTYNPSGTIELVNLEAEKMFGYPRADLLGRDIQILLAERLRADHVRLRNAFFAAPHERPLGSGRELQGRRRDGEEFPIEIGMSPMETADGMKALVSIVDMTARRRAERIQAYYAAIVESSADAIMAADLDGVVTRWNKSAETMFGWTAAEMVGQPVLRLLPPDRRDEKTAFFAHIQRGERHHFETMRCRKDGAVFPVFLTASPIRGPGGDIIGASAIVRDITERTRMEENLRASEDRFRSIFNAVAEGIFILSPATGAITDVNEAGCVMFGYAADELIGSDLQSHSTWIAPYTGLEATERIQQAATSSQPERFDWHFQARDGHHFWAEISIRSAMISGHQAVLAIVRDVTERLAVEAQLRQAQKMEAIGNLSGGMAHDFNNMLGVIIGSLDLAGPLVKDNHDVAELVEEAISAALSSAELTSRLLAFARRQTLRSERIAPNDLIAGIVRLLRRTLGEHIEIVLDLADDLWPVIADPAQLEASLTNLATNARDAMPNGGRLSIATVNRYLDADYVATHIEARAGEYAAIEVSDTGTGMVPEIAQRIFEPFYTTKEVGKGTGLGLSMVFGFIKQSGGHINVYSESGVGTTFRLYLPRAPAETARPAESLPIPPVRGAGERVLAVEDNPRLRQVVIRQLSELGYQPVEADGPAAALAILEREKIDLLFTDVMMPGPLDGMALARQVIDRWPAVRIALTSGFTGNKFDGFRDARGAAVCLISKPYRVEELAKVLRQTLHG